MAITFLKRATATAETTERDVRAVVDEMLAALEAGGEEQARTYGQQLDGWEGAIVVGETQRTEAAGALSEQLRDDIRFAHDNVRRFAEAQRASLGEVAIEVVPGLMAGHRHIPVETAGCYVPGGRYAHVASAIMSVTTARVAGVDRVVACSPPRGKEGIHPATLYALDHCGADVILNLGLSLIHI